MRALMNLCLDVGHTRRRAKKIYTSSAKQTERLKKLLGDDYETFLYSNPN